MSNRGQVPPQLAGVDDGTVLLATAASAPGLDEARSSLGEQHVIVCGDERVDPTELVAALGTPRLDEAAHRGWAVVAVHPRRRTGCSTSSASPWPRRSSAATTPDR